MEIKELILTHYGKFHNHKIQLESGINIIYGGNEAGKSTIHSFIRAMFFGLNRSRGKAAKMDEYQLRQPWDSPGAFQGSMRVEKNGKIYRIDRSFTQNAQQLQVVCEDDAVKFERPDEALDFLLGGISENAFVNTVFIPQIKTEPGDALAQELRRYMVNCDSAMDAQLDVSQALQSLRKKKKQFEVKKKTEDSILDKKIAQRQAKAEVIRTELEQMKAKAAYMRNPGQNMYQQTGRNSINGNRMSENRMNGNRNGTGYNDMSAADLKKKNKTGVGRLILILLTLLTGIGCLAGALLLEDWKLKIFLGVFSAVFFLMTITVLFLFRGDKEADEIPERVDSFRNDTDSDNRYADNGKRRIPEVPAKEYEIADPVLASAIRTREKEYQKLQDELEALYGQHVGKDASDIEIKALNMAIDRICTLSSGIYARSGGVLNERASEILSELTGGIYRRITIDETLSIQIHTETQVLDIQQVSNGTMHQIYFALRMAAGELLCDEKVYGKHLPLVLDEPFAMYDDERVAAALQWLKASGRQVVIFTCQKRERQILNQINRAARSRQPE